jgi:hypothetical protein
MPSADRERLRVKTRFSLVVATLASPVADMSWYALGGNGPRADIARPFGHTCNGCSIIREMPAEP